MRFVLPLLALLAHAHGAETRSFGGTITMISEKFDHELHNAKAFKPLKVDCSKCHNFSVNPATGKATAGEGLAKSAFKITTKQMCHDCHRSAEAQYKAAPQTCYTCHASETSLGAIKPENHRNVGWKGSHATEARIQGDSCLNCHTTSQCVKCHTHRQNIRQEVHTRNFRFTHSVQARLQPQKCDACHTKSFCVSCHLGKK